MHFTIVNLACAILSLYTTVLVLSWYETNRTRWWFLVGLNAFATLLNATIVFANLRTY
jgi:amino acid transporter